MPIDPTLGELSDQQSMTHYAPQPNLARPYLDAASNFFAPFFNPAAHGGVTGALEGAGYQLPDWATAPQSVLNNPSANQAFLLESGINLPHAPIISGSPEKLALLENLMKQKMPLIEMAKKLGVSEKSLRRHLNEAQGVRVRRKGLAWNDPKLIEQYKDMIAKGFTMEQMAAKLGTGISSVHDQLYRLSAEGHFNYAPKGGTRTPSMPSFDLPGEAAGDPEYEKALAKFLQGQQSSPARLPEINVPSLEELFDQLTTKRKP